MDRESLNDDELSQLRRSEARLKAIFESEPECVKIVDRNYCLVDMNPAGLRMIEADSLDQVRGCLLTDIVSDQYHDDFLRCADRVFAGETVNQQFEIVGLKGTHRWMDQISAPLYDTTDPERIVEMVCVTRDVTEQKATLRELEIQKQKANEANHAKSMFLANMSHEIRTPMNGVMGMTYALSQTPLSSKQKDMVDVINRSGDALLELIDHILDLSKIEYGETEIVSKAFNLHELVASTASFFDKSSANKAVQLSCHIPKQANAQYMGDPARIKQVLSNLISNALKFTEQGAVKINVELNEGRVGDQVEMVISVIDTGIGIESDKLEHVFAPFTQVDGSDTRLYGGTGLGLAICDKLCKFMNGWIKLESTLGKGSTFSFGVPIERATAVKSGEGDAASLGGSRKFESHNAKILVAEDNDLNRRVLSSLFEICNLEAVIVDCGADAVRKWQREKFDLVLLDIHMAGKNGIETVKAIREDEVLRGGLHTPIFAVTADVLSQQVEKYFAAGFDDFVAKPIDPKKLLRKIDLALNKTTYGRHPMSLSPPAAGFHS